MLVYLLQMDIQSHSRHIADRLASYYTDRREAIGLSRRLLEEVTGRGYPEMILSDYKLTKKETETLTDTRSERPRVSALCRASRTASGQRPYLYGKSRRYRSQV